MVEQTGRIQKIHSKIKVRNRIKYLYNFAKYLMIGTVIISIIKDLGGLA